MKNGLNVLVTQNGNVLEEARNCDFGLFVTDNPETNQMRTVIGGDIDELSLAALLAYAMAAVYEKTVSEGYKVGKIKSCAEAYCLMLLANGPAQASEIALEDWGE